MIDINNRFVPEFETKSRMIIVESNRIENSQHAEQQSC